MRRNGKGLQKKSTPCFLHRWVHRAPYRAKTGVYAFYVTRKVEIFRAGKQTDSAGNERDWTVADLEKIASSYKPEFHEAPVCIGHPKDNAPAWAWVKKVTCEGNSLFAEIGDEAPEFSEWLQAKRFKKRSISLYPDLSIRHLAFLGAQPPAVKGLANFADKDKRLAYAFADSGKGAPVAIDFADWSTVWALRSVGNLLQGLRDQLIETKDKETADRFLPQYDIDNLKTIQAEEKTGLYEESNMDTKQLEAALEAEKTARIAAEGKVAEFGEKLATEQGKTAALSARVSAMEAAAQEKEFSDFADAQVKAGKLLPADKASTITIMKTLAGQAPVDFAEGDKMVKKSPLDVYKARLEAGPKVISFGEKATKEGAAPPASDDELTRLTKERAAAKGISFSEAGRQVLAERPELNTTVEVA